MFVFDCCVCVQVSGKVEPLREGLPHPCKYLVVKLFCQGSLGFVCLCCDLLMSRVFMVFSL